MVKDTYFSNDMNDFSVSLLQVVQNDDAPNCP